MTVARTISGISLVLFGIFLIFVSFWVEGFSMLLGLFFLIFGVIIFFNREEDEIEQIKSRFKSNKTKLKKGTKKKNG